jgi:carbon monoxide dehydrogenase subunit G
MKLNYDGQETINANFDKVWTFINDPKKVAHCLPDLQKVDYKDEQAFDAHVKVGIGPVRGKFKFAIQLKPQLENKKMIVALRGGGLGTVVDLEAGADIIEQEDKSTLLDWTGEAVVRGPAATVGGRVLDRKARELITHVFTEVSRNLNEASVEALADESS